MVPQPEQLLTPDEVAEKLRVTRTTVYRYLRSGVLRGKKVGRHIWRVRPEDLEAFLKESNGEAQLR